jgi:hypothetical protein
MASRTFNTSTTQINSAGDHIAAKRQYTKYKTIYNDTLTNSISAKQKWNKTYVIRNCKDNKSANLVYASSHADLLDISKGKRYSNPLLNGDASSQFSSYSGAYKQVRIGRCTNVVPLTLAIKYDLGKLVTEDEINTILFPNPSQSDATGIAWSIDVVNAGGPAWPGYLLDPYSILNDNTCDSATTHSMKHLITNNAVVDYRWNIDYWRSVSKRSLNGFNYPQKVNFELQATNMKDENYLKYAPLPPLEESLSILPPPALDVCNLGISGSIIQSYNTDDRQKTFSELQLSYWCDKVPR